MEGEKQEKEKEMVLSLPIEQSPSKSEGVKHFDKVPQIYRNEDGNIIIDNEHQKTELVTHYGRESITAIGLLPKHIIDLQLEETGNFDIWSYLIRKSDNMQQNVYYQDHAMNIVSRIGVPNITGTGVDFHRVVGTYSTAILLGNNYIVDTHIALGMAIPKQRLEDRDFQNWIKAGTVNSAAVNPIMQSTLLYSAQTREMFTNCIVNHMRDGTILHDMRSMYAKLFFIALLRYRFAIEGVVPHIEAINDQRSSLVYVNTTAAELRPTTLARLAAQGYISFFKGIDFPANKLWLLEMLGVHGSYYSNQRNGRQIPAAHYILAGVSCAYFSNEVHHHYNPDVNAITIYTETCGLARARGEVTDAMYGLQLAIELVYSDVAQHIDGRRNHVPFSGNRHSMGHNVTIINDEDEDCHVHDEECEHSDDASTIGGTPDRAVPSTSAGVKSKTQASGKKGKGASKVRETRIRCDRAATPATEARRELGIGGYPANVRVLFNIDAYHQMYISPWPKPIDISWILRCLKVTTPSQPVSGNSERVFQLAISELWKIGGIIFAMLQSFTSTAFCSVGITGDVLNDAMRGHPPIYFQALWTSAFFRAPAINATSQAFIFRAAQALIGHSTTTPLGLSGQYRSWNAGRIYDGEIAEITGMYLQYGALTPYHHPVLVIDEWLWQRPLEWGVPLPTPKIDGANVYFPPKRHDEAAQIEFYNGSDIWGKVLLNSAEPGVPVPYAIIGVQTIPQAIFREEMRRLAYRYRMLSATAYSDERWDTAARNAYPQPQFLDNAPVIVPLTIRSFDYYDNIMLCPFIELQPGQLNLGLRLNNLRDNALTGAGIVLDSRIGKPLVFASRPQGLSRLAWMNQAPVNDPLLPHYATGGPCVTCGSQPCITIEEENVGHVCTFVQVYGAANTVQDVTVNASGSVVNTKGSVDKKTSSTVKDSKAKGPNEEKTQESSTTQNKGEEKKDDKKKEENKKDKDDKKKDKKKKNDKKEDNEIVVGGKDDKKSSSESDSDEGECSSDSSSSDEEAVKKKKKPNADNESKTTDKKKKKNRPGSRQRKRMNKKK